MNDHMPGNDKGLAARLAMGEAGKDPDMSARAATYLDEQTALSKAQREHLERTHALHEENLQLQSQLLRAQHAITQREADLHTENLKLQSEGLRSQHALANMQRSQLRSQRLHDRVRTVYQSVLSLVALAILTVIVYGIIDAFMDQSVVVNQFQVPPAFVAVGNNGTVVASNFLDRLHNLQVATRSHQTSLVVHDAWSNDIKLQVPDVHVTIGDIRRNLNSWLGHQIQIYGEVVQHGKQIAFTVRGTGFLAKTFTGDLGSLPTLLTDAAEYVFDQAEPYNFANYLEEHGRDVDAIALVQSAFPTASAKDKPWLLNAWGNGLSDLNQNATAVDKYRQAIRLDPHFWIAYANLENVQIQLGEQEAAYQTGIMMERLARRGSWFSAHMPELYYSNLDQLRMDLPAVHQELVDDETAHGGQGTLTTQEAPLDAEMLARMHESRQAVFILETTPGAGSDHYVIAETHFVHGLLALDQQNYSQAATEFEAVDAILTQYPALQTDFSSPPTCYLGLAEELVDDPVKADVAIARGGGVVDCYRFKGDIADIRGDWTQAQEDYQAAVNLAPSLPQAYESWGLALMRHGDFVNAIVKFQDANKRGPHWCDPLEHWGEALTDEGHYKEAVKKYSQAAQYTPGWGALQLHWGEALDALGQHEEARIHYSLAQSLGDLSAGERATLVQHINQKL